MNDGPYIEKAIEYFKNLEAEPPFVVCEEQRSQMIRILEEHKTMISMLRGQCWACKHGKPYKEQFGGVYENNAQLTICTIGKHDKNTIAKTVCEGCESWELKKK